MLAGSESVNDASRWTGGSSEVFSHPKCIPSFHGRLDLLQTLPGYSDYRREMNDLFVHCVDILLAYHLSIYSLHCLFYWVKANLAPFLEDLGHKAGYTSAITRHFLVYQHAYLYIRK